MATGRSRGRSLTRSSAIRIKGNNLFDRMVHRLEGRRAEGGGEVETCAGSQEASEEIVSIRVVALLCLSLLIAPSHAQHMNEPDSPCAGIGGTGDLVACLSKAGISSDRELNSFYQRLRAKLDPGEAAQLVKVQRLWIQYRDANCTAERSLYGNGTGGPPAYLACLEAMARSRTKELSVTYVLRLK
jgi:uncharacterized protein YecT (DUF1311 family)